jgi:short-subunit dehydrogenase
MKIQNKVMVITGGGNGIGRELVLALLARGASVAAVDISESALQETKALAENHESKLSIHVVDITQKEAVEALPDLVIAKHGVVDGIINNAGIIQPFVRLNDLEYVAIDRVMDINFYGTLFMVKAFLPHLLKRPEGHIANISSMGGFLPVPGQTIYGASKAAVKLLTEGLYSELLDSKVKVTIIFPGAISTNIAGNSGVSVGETSAADQKKMKTLPADQAADAIIDGIEKDKYRILVGQDAKLMDFIARLAPKWAAEFIYKQMGSLLPK